MDDWIIKEHPDFFKDLDKLTTPDLQTFYNKKKKIKQDPLRLKHLSGGQNCYREPITSNIRLVYYVQGNTIWLLTIDKHEEAYDKFKNRLYSLKTKYSNLLE